MNLPIVLIINPALTVYAFQQNVSVNKNVRSFRIFYSFQQVIF